MSLPLAVIAMVLMLAGFALYVMLAFRLFKRLRTAVQQRGYKSPVVLTGTAVVAFTLPFVCALLLIKITGRNDDALWWILLLFLAVPLVLTVAVRFLPARNPRTAGQRTVHFPYRSVGYVLLGGAAVLWTTAAVTNKPGVFQLGVQFMLGGLGCLVIARRAAVPDASAVRWIHVRQWFTCGRFNRKRKPSFSCHGTGGTFGPMRFKLSCAAGVGVYLHWSNIWE